MSRCAHVFAWAAACVRLAAVAAAQEPNAGRLAGTVRDSTGAVLPGVVITITATPAAPPRRVVSDANGTYEFENVRFGHYVIHASLTGFDPQAATLDIVGPTTHDIVLAVSPFAERVTVTANKAGPDDIQSTAMAVAALPARTLEDLAVESIERVAGLTPSLTVTHSPGGHVLIAIRGVGTNSAVAGADPSTTVYLDGVYLSRPATISGDLLDVERIEILRGPQGTLYGRNSVGGAIHILTRPPANVLETEVRLSAGNFEHLRTEGVVRGPLIRDRIMGSFAFVRGTRRGFVDDLDHPENALGGENTWAGRGQIRVVLGRRSDLLLSGDYGRFTGTPLTYAKPLRPKDGITFDTLPGLWDVRASDVASGRNVQRGAAARLTLHLEASTTVTSVTALRRSSDRFFIDRDATELSLLTVEVPNEQRQLSQEIVMAHRGSRVAWIGGALVFADRDRDTVEITDIEAAIQSRPYFTSRTLALGTFGQISYDLSSRVTLTAGLRFSRERKNVHTTGGIFRRGTWVLARPGSFYDFSDSATFHAWTPRASVGIDAARDTFVYLSAARGFKSGGFNPMATRRSAAFGPEFAWNYEAGVKRTLAGGHLRANAAAFYTDYRDLQVQTWVATGVIDIRNAASATVIGVEAETAAAVGRHLQVSTHLTWLRAAYDRYLAAGSGGVTVDASARRLNNAPDWSGGGSALYHMTAGPRILSVRADLSWRSRAFFTPFNDAAESQGAYALVHVRAGIEPRSRRWQLAVYARNVSRTEYVTGTLTNLQLPAINGRPGEPRMWGTQLTIRR